MTTKVNPFAGRKDDEKEEKKVNDPTKIVFSDDDTKVIRIVCQKDAPQFCILYNEIRIQEVNEKWPTTIIQAPNTNSILDEHVQSLWGAWKELKETLGSKEEAKKSVEGKKILAEINALSGKEKSAMLVIDRTDGTVKKLYANQTITKAIEQFYNDPDYNDPSDPVQGYDLKIVTEGKKENRKY